MEEKNQEYYEKKLLEMEKKDESENGIIVPRSIAENDFELIIRAARVRWERYKRAVGEQAEEEREAIIEAIMYGEITVSDNGFPIYRPLTNDDDVREFNFYRRITGADVLRGNRSKDDDRKWFIAAGEFFKVAPAKIENLDGGDITMLQTLWVLFFRNGR